MLESFTAGTFTERHGETFRIRVDDSSAFDAELIEVSVAGDDRAGTESRRTPFSLVFRGPKEIVLPQRIYNLEHAELGTFELFLVPIGPDDVGMRYEAVFA